MYIGREGSQSGEQINKARGFNMRASRGCCGMKFEGAIGGVRVSAQCDSLLGQATLTHRDDDLVSLPLKLGTRRSGRILSVPAASGNEQTYGCHG